MAVAPPADAVEEQTRATANADPGQRAGSEFLGAPLPTTMHVSESLFSPGALVERNADADGGPSAKGQG